MDDRLRKDIEAIKADPDLVEFVLAWHGLIGGTTVPFTAEKESEAYQRKIKRWTQRDWGTKWRGYWQLIVKEWKTRRGIVLQRNLFKMEPRGLNPNHRPRNQAIWSAVFDLRNYFEKKSGRPHMGLLARLLFPKEQEVTFHGEWQERKAWFKDEKGDERLEQLERFYAHHHDRIIKTLRTGIPFYAKWESASSPSLSGVSR